MKEELIQLRATGTGQDGVRYPANVTGKLGHLANAGRSADFRPTDEQHRMQELLREILREPRATGPGSVRPDHQLNPIIYTSTLRLPSARLMRFSWAS